MTQTALAKKLGVSQATISLWLSGKAKPTGNNKKILKEKDPELFKKLFPEENV